MMVIDRKTGKLLYSNITEETRKKMQQAIAEAEVDRILRECRPARPAAGGDAS